MQYSGNPAEIEQAVIDIIAKEGSVPRDKITLDATLQDLDVHSLDGVQIIFAIEDKFDIVVPEEQAQHATGTVRQLIDGVIQLAAAKGASA
jgi:acyl carrier protein